MGLLTINGHEAECALASGDAPGQCSWCGADLPARRRRWCSDPCGHAWADQHCWTNAKQLAKERAGYRCERCGADPLTLHVHHITEVDPQHGYEAGCQHHADGLEVLCPTDHKLEHSWRREVDRILVWSDGQVSRQLVLPGVGG